jgi:hypothetical protein
MSNEPKLDIEALDIISKEIKNEKQEKETKSVVSKAELFLAQLYGPTTSTSEPKDETQSKAGGPGTDMTMQMSEEEFMSQCVDVLMNEYGYTDEGSAKSDCALVRDKMVEGGMSFKQAAKSEASPPPVKQEK